MKRIPFVILMLAAVTLPAAAEVVHIDNAQLQELLSRGVPVVDVRTPPEWQQTGVVEGSHLLMFFDARGRYDVEKWLGELRAVARPEKPVILICRTGSRTSSISAFLAGQAGYHKVYNVRRGITAWIDEGRPTSAPGPSH